jgi:hypothetical protein
VLNGGNKKDTKTKKSKKKKTGTKTFCLFANMKDDDPRSVKLAISLEIHERMDLMNRNKK